MSDQESRDLTIEAEDGLWTFPGRFYCLPIEAVGSRYGPKISAPRREYVRADLCAPADDRVEALEAENVRLREEVAALKSPPEEYCAKCGSPKSNHPYRHPFTSRAALRDMDMDK